MYTIVRQITPELRKQGREFIDAYHSYIKYSDRPSRKMYWNLYENGKFVGVFGLGSVFDKPKSVKQFMERYCLHPNEIANNIVFCLHGCQDKNSGTRFLSMLRKDAAKWWDERYGDKLKAFQTFILPPRNGAVYKADNWQQIGITSGNAQRVYTIPAVDADKYFDVKKVVFKDGTVRYCRKEYVGTEKKLIFMKLVS